MQSRTDSDTHKLAPQSGQSEHAEPTRREFLAAVGSAAAVTAFSGKRAFAQGRESALNVAKVAVPSSRSLLSENKISALNDGFAPADSFDRSHALYSLWADKSAGERESWVQYEWSEPVEVNKVEVYWAVDHPRPGEEPDDVGGRVAAANPLPAGVLGPVLFDGGDLLFAGWRGGHGNAPEGLRGKGGSVVFSVIHRPAGGACQGWKIYSMKSTTCAL